VPDDTVPPIEWVSAGGHWWVPRIAIPAVVAAIAGLVLYLGWFVAGFGNGSSLGFVDVGLIVLLAIMLLSLYAFPSVRRIGISPKGLIVDVGFRKFGYSWAHVNDVARTQVSHYRWNQVSSVSRTRISVGSGLTQNTFTLSPSQGERLAKFLRIP